MVQIGVFIMLEHIAEKINETVEALKLTNYKAEDVFAQEFYDYMTGETFSETRLLWKTSWETSIL